MGGYNDAMKPGRFCRGCKDRTIEPNCHSTCEKYLNAINEWNAYKELVESNRKQERDYLGMKVNNVRDTIKKSKAKVIRYK